jgi:hypothetical protein
VEVALSGGLSMGTEAEVALSGGLWTVVDVIIGGGLGVSLGAAVVSLGAAVLDGGLGAGVGAAVVEGMPRRVVDLIAVIVVGPVIVVGGWIVVVIVFLGAHVGAVGPSRSPTAGVREAKPEGLSA